MDEFALRVFAYTADFSSLSKAALFLRVSQPAISRSIRSSQQLPNSTLLVRHGRGVTLTSDGQRFLEHAKSIVGSMDRAKRDLAALRAEPEGTVKFGMPTSVGSVLLPNPAGFSKHYPGVTLVGIGGRKRRAVRVAARRTNSDVAVIHEPSPSKNSAIEEVLLQERYLVGRATRELRAKQELSVAELAKFPLVLPMSGREPRIRLEQAVSAIGASLNCVI